MIGLIIALAVLLGITAVASVGIVVTYAIKKKNNSPAIEKTDMQEVCPTCETTETAIKVEEPVIEEISVTEPVEEEPEIEAIPEVVEDDTEIYLGRDEETGFAIIARFKKSFLARLIQSPEQTKEYYSQLKNAILSYKKTKSRISWNYDSVNSGRLKVLKFNVRGKTLCMYTALDAQEFEGTKYNVKAITSKKYAEVPCMIKVSGPRKLKHALELIDILAEKLGLEKGEEKNDDYKLPFETTEALIAKDLIKELVSKEDYEEYLARRKAMSAKTQEEVAVTEPVEEEPEIEVIPEVVEDDTEIYLGRDEETGFAIIARFKKSFLARLIQSPEQTKEYYSQLKNAILSYKKTKSRISWNYDSVNSGRVKVLKFNVRGKTLCMYTALDAQEFEGTKYNVKAITSKKYAEVPCMIKVSGPRKLKHALELIDILAGKLGLEKGEEKNDDYKLPFETTEALIAKDLIKELVSKEDYEEYLARRKAMSAKTQEEVAVTEPVEEEPEIEVIPEVVEDDTEIYLGRDEETGFAIIARFKKSFLARLIQSPEQTKEYYSQLKNAILSYKKTKSRISWNYDSVNSGRVKVLKFNVRGKTLCMYTALDAQEFEGTKYNVKAITSKKYAEVPCMIKVSGPRKLKHALELIDILAGKLGLEKGEEKNDDYKLPFETTEALIAKDLIKELVSKEDYEAFIRRRKSMIIINKKHKDVVTAEEVDKIISDEVAAAVVVDEHHEFKLGGEKCVINIDTLSRCYNANELVNMKSLKQKGLLPKNAGYVKVLARGTLNKPLTVEANDYSIEAVKMILLTGGTVLKY